MVPKLETMRILVYSENDYGCGASIVAWMLAAEYAKLGHKVVYVFQNEHQNGSTADKVKKIHFKASDINLKNKLANVYFTCWFILFAILAKLPFSKEINEITHACGYEHPSQIKMEDIDVSMGDNNQTVSLNNVYDYEKTVAAFQWK